MTNLKGVDQRSLEEFFPLESARDIGAGGKTAIERLNGDQRALSAEVAAAGGRHEPGEGYTIYRSRDVSGAIPEEMEMVIAYGARWVGVEEEMILKVSEGYERRLWSWWLRIRREEASEARRGLTVCKIWSRAGGNGLGEGAS